MLYNGRPISPGVARGPAMIVDARELLAAALHVPAHGPEAVERERLMAAIGRALAQLARVKRQLDRRVAGQDALIFETHASLLRDARFVEQLDAEIAEQGQSAESAVARVINQNYAAFAANPAPLVRDKAADLLDIGRRLLQCLSVTPVGDEVPLSGTVIVAATVTPSELVHYAHHGIAAVVTEVCGSRSHTAILARGLGIPLVTGVAALGTVIRPHVEVLVDASAGQVIVEPTPAEQPLVERLLERLRQPAPPEPALRQVARSRDGLRIGLLLNISDYTEAEAVRSLGADGVGLFRTEFLYMNHERWPSEEECYQDYRRVADRLSGFELNLRLADFGAEKCPAYADIPTNRNPSLGLRGTRLLLQREDILRPQLRAVARLAADRPLTVLLPMIDSLDTLARTVSKLCEILGAGDRTALPFRLGAMIEIPSAALLIDEILPRVDAVSIGLNDLTQYLLAADRDDELVESYHDAMQPVVLRLLKRIAEAGAAQMKPVTICGELAGDPSLTGLLLALGLRRLSVGRTNYRAVLSAICEQDVRRLEGLGPEVLALSTAAEVRRWVQEHILARRNG